jgi:hypothetical protein
VKDLNIESPIFSILVQTNAILAGGAIRDLFLSEEPKDYDFFFLSKQDLQDAISFMISNGWKAVDSRFYTITFSRDEFVVQFVFKTFFEKEEDIYKDFDFVNVMASLSLDFGGNQKISCHPDFQQVNLDKVVKINVITKVFESFKRLRPYLKKGFCVDEAYDYIVSLFDSRKGEKGVLMLSEFYE